MDKLALYNQQFCHHGGHLYLENLMSKLEFKDYKAVTLVIQIFLGNSKGGVFFKAVSLATAILC